MSVIDYLADSLGMNVVSTLERLQLPQLSYDDRPSPSVGIDARLPRGFVFGVSLYHPHEDTKTPAKHCLMVQESGYSDKRRSRGPSSLGQSETYHYAYPVRLSSGTLSVSNFAKPY